MITYVPVGRLPSEITPRVLGRIGRSFEGVRNVPRAGVVGVRFLSAAAIQRLNQQFRDKNRPTDVLSFSTREGTPFPGTRGEELGDLMVCPSVARAEARRRGMDAQEELIRLLVHGTLHLAGYDHATEPEEQAMFRIQERLVDALT